MFTVNFYKTYIELLKTFDLLIVMHFMDDSGYNEYVWELSDKHAIPMALNLYFKNIIWKRKKNYYEWMEMWL